jgi:sulfate transport system permease protein
MSATPRRRLPTEDAPAVRATLLAAAAAAFLLLIGLPLGFLLTGALHRGVAGYAHAITDPATRAAARLTATVLIAVIPVNVVFGLSAAWAIARFDFPGRGALLALLDLPFAVSPVISGLVFVLLFGARAPLGPWLASHHLHILFATPSIVLATVFVTFPYVARELIPAFESLGTSTEDAALVAGASGWQMFMRVTLPSVRPALISGIALATARAAGEFGAVAVVSGHIAGRTNTLPLHIASLYDGGDPTAAFAVASVLLVLALLTLAVRWTVDHHTRPR